MLVTTRVAGIALGSLAVALLVGSVIGLVWGAWGLLGLAVAASFFVILALVWLDTPAEAMEDWVP